MFKPLRARLWDRTTDWLNAEPEGHESYFSNFDRLRSTSPGRYGGSGGRSRLSNTIKSITLSSWMHAALYIGRLHHIEDPDLLYYLEYHFDDAPTEPLLIEALLGAGTMGGEIAVWIALQSFCVTAQDKNPKALAVMLKRATGQFAKNLKLEPEIRAAPDRLMPDPMGCISSTPWRACHWSRSCGPQAVIVR